MGQGQRELSNLLSSQRFIFLSRKAQIELLDAISASVPARAWGVVVRERRGMGWDRTGWGVTENSGKQLEYHKDQPLEGRLARFF